MPESVCEEVRRSARRPQEVDDLALRGMSSELRLLKNGNVILENLESATGARPHGDLGVRELPRKLGRQTGSPGLVVSNGAVFDGNVHHVGYSGYTEIKYSVSAIRPALAADAARLFCPRPRCARSGRLTEAAQARSPFLPIGAAACPASQRRRAANRSGHAS